MTIGETPLLTKEGRPLRPGWFSFITVKMESKYNVPKKRKPETKQEEIAAQIEDLVKQRDRLSNPAEKEKIQKEIMTLFAQYERLKL